MFVYLFFIIYLLTFFFFQNATCEDFKVNQGKEIISSALLFKEEIFYEINYKLFCTSYYLFKNNGIFLSTNIL